MKHKCKVHKEVVELYSGLIRNMWVIDCLESTCGTYYTKYWPIALDIALEHLKETCNCQGLSHKNDCPLWELPV